MKWSKSKQLVTGRFAQSCQKSVCSIRAMDVQTELGREKLLTIEVRNEEGLIRQARGRLNRRPTDEEREMLGRWVELAGLEVAVYV